MGADAISLVPRLLSVRPDPKSSTVDRSCGQRMADDWQVQLGRISRCCCDVSEACLCLRSFACRLSLRTRGDCRAEFSAPPKQCRCESSRKMHVRMRWCRWNHTCTRVLACIDLGACPHACVYLSACATAS